MRTSKYKIRVIKGAFVNPTILDDLGAKTIEKTERKEWVSIEELIVDSNEIRDLQKQMVKHYDDNNVPWYLDGYSVENKNDCVVAFGADDGEDGKLFKFNIKDKITVNRIIKYGMNKGIPKEQLNWMDIKF